MGIAVMPNSWERSGTSSTSILAKLSPAKTASSEALVYMLELESLERGDMGTLEDG